MAIPGRVKPAELRSRATLVALAIALVIAAACSGISARVDPRPGDPTLGQASASEVASPLVCHDTLGRTAGGFRVLDNMPCTPCNSYGVQGSAEDAASQARRLWLQGARAPFDTFDVGARCVRRAYRYARALRPKDDSLAIEMSLVELAMTLDSTRALALRTVDSLLQERITEGRRTQASNMMAQFALGIWDRAQRALERPDGINVDRIERRAHQLASGAPLMTQLPAIPQTSEQLGVSEAEWAARLFDAAARLATSPGERSRLMRLALAPWVVIEDWAALDSAAQALLKRAPNDSAVLPARALAAYRAMNHPVIGAPAVMALFDTVVAHVPRADSVRMDSFDGVLTAKDDDWRYGFLPDQRIALDLRGWAVIDPMWSTPVNEILLARRARVAEADYRYADIAKKDESGSETRPGQMLLRRGAPTPQWSVNTTRNGNIWIQRSWRGLTAHAQLVDVPQTWRVFYGTHFTATSASTYATERSCASAAELFPSLYTCAVGERAEWTDVPFVGRTDAIDVTVARFRAGGDSADVYIGARIPLRAFRSKDNGASNRADRIVLGAWLNTEFGRPVFHEEVSRELPASATLAWTQQWKYRAGSLRMMHRVEAMEPRQPAGARGIARFTTDAQVTFPMRGFGMSDVLIAAAATPKRGETRRWTDLEFQPNGASIAPGVRFAMIWEVYDLERGADGRVHWRVRIKRERGNMVVREDMQRVLSGAPTAGSRIVAGESDAPDMSYERHEAAADAVLDNITFGLSDAGLGHHVVNVTIDDLVSGRSVTRGVSVRVLIPESQRRGTKIGSR